MGRKRYITSDMSIDERIANIASENPVAALMWPWFITGFDDWGRMEAVPMKIKLSIFPAFPYTAKDIEQAIELYAASGLVHKYEVNGKYYLAIDPQKYYKYQTYIRSSKRELDDSNCPPPPNPPWGDDEELQTAEDSAETLLGDNSHADARTCAQGSADERICVPSPSPSPSLSPSPSGTSTTSEQSPDEPQEPQNEGKKSKRHIIPLFSEDTVQYQLAMFMRQCILENLPGAKVPEPSAKGLKRWAYDIDLMIRIDNRSPDEIRALIDWSHRDSFWKANILSPGKLREKWDTLVAHRQREFDAKKAREEPKKHIPRAFASLMELSAKGGLRKNDTG
ncbi:hypothetical protein D2962_09575 [Biomaibacter acetigenes]|uniref:Phage replisome organiser N-terminal domain-containing protein n=1 Tax=Biomaibacter acetigenes TaxID=2316383 RepID=A0A3G2R5Y8_9FIRM|nr:hypothetical protein [Biomaibacter acetigenes]AYO30829.1 hypothetical protein D2962_09575 [Biomaibacter acetigenes]